MHYVTMAFSIINSSSVLSPGRDSIESLEA